MIVEKNICPWKAVVLLEDRDGGEVPGDFEAPASASESAVAIACMAECDGDTEFVLAIDHAMDLAGLVHALSVDLPVPSGQLVVRDPYSDEVLLSVEVGAARHSVQVWMSDLRWPARIVVHAVTAR